MTVGDIIQIIALVVTAIGLIFSINSFRKQMQLNFFADYTKRYQDIMVNLPEEIYMTDFKLNTLDIKTRDIVLRYVRLYFDLCSEEYYLFLNKNIDKKTWNEWLSGIKYLLSNKCFSDVWQEISLNTYYYKDFTALMKDIFNKMELIEAK